MLVVMTNRCHQHDDIGDDHINAVRHSSSHQDTMTVTMVVLVMSMMPVVMPVTATRLATMRWQQRC